MSELRTIVIVVAFLGTTIALVGMMTMESPFLFSGYTNKGTTPVYGNNTAVNPSEVIGWNETLVLPLNNSGWSFILSFEVGGWNLRAYIDKPYGVNAYYIELETYDKFEVLGLTLWEHGHQDFTWYNSSNQRVSRNDIGFMAPLGSYYPEVIGLDQLGYDYIFGNSSSSMNNLQYNIKNSHTKLTVSFGFNNTLYDSPLTCFINGGNLDLCFQIQWSDRNTSMNALDFISAMFSFRLPDVEPTVQAMIMAPILGALMYLTFIFILRIVGAVFGGGGA